MMSKPPSDPAKINDWLAEQQPYIEAVDRRINELIKTGIPFTVAIAMAGDQVMAEKWQATVEAGEAPAVEVVNLIGSYARFDYAVAWVERGWLTTDWLRANLAELWRGSDPDDTSPAYLRVWRQAWLANGMRPIRDGRPLPKGRDLIIYRGQQPNEPIGFAWSTDPKIAMKFARGIRGGTLRGDVIRASVPVKDVMGYLTGRGEAEVIADPREVTILSRKRVGAA